MKDLDFESSKKLNFHDRCYANYTQSKTLASIKEKEDGALEQNLLDNDDQQANQLRKSDRNRQGLNYFLISNCMN